MGQRREVEEILYEIKKEILGFNKEELLEYTIWAIPKLYDEIKNYDNISKKKIKCKKELINKLIEEPRKYRITNEMDNVNVQYAELYECIKENGEFYIKVYASIYFYDNRENNIYMSARNRYWNDIWIITLRETDCNKIEDGNCDNCGAVMEYDEIKKIFKCTYCGNVLAIQKWDKDWEFVDIEVNP